MLAKRNKLMHNPRSLCCCIITLYLTFLSVSNSQFEKKLKTKKNKKNSQSSRLTELVKVSAESSTVHLICRSLLTISRRIESVSGLQLFEKLRGKKKY